MFTRKTPWIAAAALCLAGCGGELAAPDALATPSAVAVRQNVSQQALPIDRVPRELLRRATQLLEDVRSSESAQNWKTATLASSVEPLLRPDVAGVAYYEFRVLVREQPAGFIIVSTGDHDYPIAHWNFEGLSPTETLMREAGTRVSAFYKVDALSYVAEGPQGELLAKMGSLPNRIVGQDPAWLDKSIPATDVRWVSSVSIPDDREGASAEPIREVSGPATPDKGFELTGWSSWKELKDGYRGSYATMAESLRRQAAEEWQIDAVAQESGEGLVVGRSFELALLYPRAEYRLGGEGARGVRAELVTTEAGSQKLVLTAFSASPGKPLPMNVDVFYGNGMSETVRFTVLDAGDVSKPASGAQPEQSGVRWADMDKLGAWSAWNTFFAGTHSDQRLYSQFAGGSSPNTSSCYSGCGATAWAMLMGWGDFQASVNNPTWSNRWGLYRVNGGYGNNAVAPATMDSGVRNMTWELRNRVGTFCNPFNDSGATAPWNMDGAGGYLKNRSGASLSTHYNVFGVHETRLREKARDSIIDRKVPAIIGTGWLTHYPLAYGYRWRSRTVNTCVLFICWSDTEYQRQFYANEGWGGSGNGWIGAGTWFAGQLYPN